MSLASTDDIEANLQRWAANPPAPQEEGFSLTSFIGAGLKGVPAAVLEMSGGALDATSGYGNVMAATGGTPRGMFSLPTEDERKQEADARKRMLAGDNQNVSAGNLVRKKAEEFAPDPITANRADQVIFGLTRFGGKALGYVGTMGPLGAIPLGLEEGNTETQKLRLKGIDDLTATKVGAVQGVTSAVGAVMPLGGKTVLQTLGLVAAGGPGMFMAQEATSRAILQHAAYADEASLHNPFDPLGLALSTVVPGAFGALHMRNVNKAAPQLVDVVKHIESGGNPNAVGPNIPGQGTAKGEMQVMDATNVDPGFGVTPAKDNSPEERARVGREYLGAMVTRYGDQDKALAAYNAGPGTVDKAMAAHGDSWLAHMPEETQKYVAKARKLTGDYVASEGAKSPEVVDAARVSVLNDTIAKSLPDAPDAYANVMRAADIVAESGGRAAEAVMPPVHVTELPQFKEWFGESKVVDEAGEPLTVYHGTKADVAEFKEGTGWFTTDPGEANMYGGMNGEGANVMPAYVSIKHPRVLEASETSRAGIEDAVGSLRGDEDGVLVVDKGRVRWAIVADPKTQIKSAIGNSGKFDSKSPSLTDPLKAGEQAIRWRESTNALPAADSVRVAGDQPAARGAEVGTAGNLPDAAAVSNSPAAAQTMDQTVAKKLAAEQPDLVVTLPGTDERITVAEAMKRIAEEHKQDGQWADLVRVAAECALGA